MSELREAAQADSKLRNQHKAFTHWFLGLHETTALAPEDLAWSAWKAALAQPESEAESITILPDESAFGVMSFPLPDDHWLYAERVYDPGEYEPVELPAPILTHALRDQVVAAIRYAVRGATNCGKEIDFDPDALVQNAVYALCGPYTATVRMSCDVQPPTEESA